MHHHSRSLGPVGDCTSLKIDRGGQPNPGKTNLIVKCQIRVFTFSAAYVFSFPLMHAFHICFRPHTVYLRVIY